MAAIRVECYAGYKADERPLRFSLGENVVEIADVEDRWYSPGATYFRVRGEDGNFYVLRHDEGMDVWTLDAFRAARGSDAPPPPVDLNVEAGPHGPC